MSDRFRSTLLILRHAHSSWARPGERDHQRPLDERGSADAARLATIIKTDGVAIDTVVCSTATRARETLEALMPALADRVEIQHSDDLYALGTEAYYAAAGAVGEEAHALLIVGHNPTIEDFTRSLIRSGESDALNALAEGFATCALAIVGFEGPLGEAAPQSGHLIRVIRP
ncbi:histidine phosphatase family protein [Jiella sp. MQZ9-1]|uniref:Histidine phosphatase family protein n=1 Tax=Jiella flava TaxID=2816857 RepID=A0A939JWF6_9HYPH|nr:histidine phosphatase family protein [Jiella flava]MBO0662992.1 histidine phosphatase family protein [Jiella flava]MCD2471249.1 histidine phosphatase family protein [Jiella flava]